MNILGKPEYTQQQVVDAILRYHKANGYDWMPFVSVAEFVRQAYLAGDSEGVRGDVIVAQAILETGWMHMLNGNDNNALRDKPASGYTGSPNPPVDTGVPLPGESTDYSARFVKLAREQIGTYGSKYWDWMWGYRDEWCACYVTWLGHNLGYGSKGWPKDGWVPNWLDVHASYSEGAKFRKFKAGAERPKPGDLFIVNGGSHIGTVGWIEPTSKYFQSSEGNSMDAYRVTKQDRLIVGGNVTHYLRPNYKYFEGA